MLAAHFTALPGGLKATAVETVRFERPERISFRLVRGPVPEVEETFELHDNGGGRTRLVYRGELWLGVLAAESGPIRAQRPEALSAAEALDPLRVDAQDAHAWATSHLAPRTSHLAPRTSHLAPRTA